MSFHKLLFPWKPVEVQLGTISENACIGNCYQCAKFHACIKKGTICLKFRAMPPDYKKNFTNNPLLMKLVRSKSTFFMDPDFVLSINTPKITRWSR